MIPVIYSEVKSAAAEATTIKTRTVPAGCIFVCERIFARDKTTDTTTSMEIGIHDGSKLIPIYGLKGTATKEAGISIEHPVTLNEGQGIYATFTTPSAADNLELNCVGYLMAKEEC